MFAYRFAKNVAFITPITRGLKDSGGKGGHLPGTVVAFITPITRGLKDRT